MGLRTRVEREDGRTDERPTGSTGGARDDTGRISLRSAMETWRGPLDRSIARNKRQRGSNYVQLATCTREGDPRVRTVVQRGLAPDPAAEGTALVFVTDARAEKCRQIEHRPRGEICWYFAKTREQYRIRGSLCLIRPDTRAEGAAREAQLLLRRTWGNLSDQTRQTFFGPHPGRPLACDEDEAVVPNGGRDPDTNKVLPPPRTFNVLLMRPDRVDLLDLKNNARQIYEKATGPSIRWSSREVNP